MKQVFQEIKNAVETRTSLPIEIVTMTVRSADDFPSIVAELEEIFESVETIITEKGAVVTAMIKTHDGPITVSQSESSMVINFSDLFIEHRFETPKRIKFERCTEDMMREKLTVIANRLDSLPAHGVIEEKQLEGLKVSVPIPALGIEIVMYHHNKGAEDECATLEIQQLNTRK